MTWPNQSLPTRRTFTGQYSYVAHDATDLGASGFGLMYFGARYYDPLLGRFSSADTVVPKGAQGYDRYAFVNNNPVRYTDPTGHEPHGPGSCYDVDDPNCPQPLPAAPTQSATPTPGPAPTAPGTPKQSETDENQADTGLSVIHNGSQGQTGTAWSITLPPLFACDWLDCGLSFIGLAASAVDTFALEIPQASVPALLVDIGATVYSISRTDNDYAAGEISKTRQYALNSSAFGGLEPVFKVGFVLSIVNFAMTITGWPP